MHRNRITLFALAFALSAAAIVSGNQRVASASNVSAHTNLNSLFPVLGETLPSKPPQTVRVRLKVVETNADLIDSPVADTKVIIKAGGDTLDRKSNKNGVIVFDAVPCGGEITITVKNDVGGPDGVFRRRIPCGKGLVDLGVLEQSFGGKYILQLRRTQFMGYDPTRNVWRTEDGKIVPSRIIRRIMDQRQRL